MVWASVVSFVTNWWKLGLGGFAGAALWIPIGYIHGKSDSRLEYEAERAITNAKLLEDAAASKDTAAAERLRDALTISKAEGELVHALRKVPDEQPDAVRIKLGCERLRRQGKNTSSIPACSGSGS